MRDLFVYSTVQLWLLVNRCASLSGNVWYSCVCLEKSIPFEEWREILFMVVFQLMDMGFTREHAVDALLNTNSLEQATDYILSHPPPTAVVGSGASRVGHGICVLSLFLVHVSRTVAWLPVILVVYMQILGYWPLIWRLLELFVLLNPIILVGVNHMRSDLGMSNTVAHLHVSCLHFLSCVPVCVVTGELIEKASLLLPASGPVSMVS